MKRNGQTVCYVKVTHVNNSYAYVRRGDDGEVKTVWKFDRRAKSGEVKVHSSSIVNGYPQKGWRFIEGMWKSLYVPYMAKLWQLAKKDDEITMQLATEDDVIEFVKHRAWQDGENRKIEEYRIKKQATVNRLMEVARGQS
jgi:hypothetical protein